MDKRIKQRLLAMMGQQPYMQFTPQNYMDRLSEWLTPYLRQQPGMNNSYYNNMLEQDNPYTYNMMRQTYGY